MGSTIIPGVGEGATVDASQPIAGVDEGGLARPVKASSGGAIYVAAGDASADAFGRLRTNGAIPLFANEQLYAKDTLFFDEALTGTGTSTFVTNEASVRLRVAANADKVVRQTRQYFPYHPGQSQLFLITGILGEVNDANVRQRIGCFDDDNGYFFQNVNGTLNVVRRTSTSGSPVDNSVAQASWNLDTLDGSGPSGVTFDETKANIFVIDYAWLGVGSARLGIAIGGRIVYCHEFKNENTLTTVHIASSALPVRYEIEATGAPAGNTDMRHICVACFSEGSTETIGLVLSKNLGITGRSAGTGGVPLISLRAKSTRPRVTIIPKDVSVLPTVAADLLIEIVIGGTLTAATYADTTTSENVDVDTAATAISGGTVIGSFHASASNQAGSSLAASVESALRAASSIDGTTRDDISLVVYSTTGTPNCLASITWEEQY